MMVLTILLMLGMALVFASQIRREQTLALSQTCAVRKIDNQPIDAAKDAKKDVRADILRSNKTEERQQVSESCPIAEEKTDTGPKQTYGNPENGSFRS